MHKKAGWGLSVLKNKPDLSALVLPFILGWEDGGGASALFLTQGGSLLGEGNPRYSHGSLVPVQALHVHGSKPRSHRWTQACPILQFWEVRLVVNCSGLHTGEGPGHSPSDLVKDEKMPRATIIVVTFYIFLEKKNFMFVATFLTQQRTPPTRRALGCSKPSGFCRAMSLQLLMETASAVSAAASVHAGWLRTATPDTTTALSQGFAVSDLSRAFVFHPGNPIILTPAWWCNALREDVSSL